MLIHNEQGLAVEHVTLQHVLGGPTSVTYFAHHTTLQQGRPFCLILPDGRTTEVLHVTPSATKPERAIPCNAVQLAIEHQLAEDFSPWSLRHWRLRIEGVRFPIHQRGAVMVVSSGPGMYAITFKNGVLHV